MQQGNQPRLWASFLASDSCIGCSLEWRSPTKVFASALRSDWVPTKTIGTFLDWERISGIHFSLGGDTCKKKYVYLLGCSISLTWHSGRWMAWQHWNRGGKRQCWDRRGGGGCQSRPALECHTALGSAVGHPRAPPRDMYLLPGRHYISWRFDGKVLTVGTYSAG